MSLDDEVDANFEAFQALLPEVIGARRGEYALLRHRQVEGYFATLKGALEAGLGFTDRMFSIQEVTDRVEDLGLFSHAIDTRIA